MLPLQALAFVACINPCRGIAELSGWTVGRVLRRAGVVVQEEGWRSLWFKVLGEIIYRRVVVMERLLSEPVPQVQTAFPVSVQLLTGDDVNDYLLLRPDADPAVVRQRLARGHTCIGLCSEGCLVHVSWVASSSAHVGYLGCDIELAPGDAYTYEAYTAPEVRGCNLSPYRIAWMMDYLRERGYRRLILVVMPENRTAFRPVQKVGCQPIGMLGCIRLGNWRHCFSRACGSLSADAGMPSCHTWNKSSISTYWDDVTRRVSSKSHYLDVFLGEMKRQAHLDLLGQWGGLSSGRTLKTDVFEEGTGPDGYLSALGALEGFVIGMDISSAAAKNARRRGTEARAYYLAADVRHLPFPDKAFDLIISPSTLDHFPDSADLGRSLRELRRVLAPAGRLMITLDNRQNVFDPLLRLVSSLHLVPYYLGRSYTIHELRAELENAGYRVVETATLLHNPRLVAVGVVRLAKLVNWRPLCAFVQRMLISAQRAGNTRFRYYTGSFVAALAQPDDREG